MKNTWRITKYDPLYRGDQGVYTKEDWVGLYQIGKVFNGKELDVAEYIISENKYVAAALKFIEESKFDLVKLNNWHGINEVHDQIPDGLMINRGFEDGQLIDKNDIDLVLRMLLRGIAYAKLEVSNVFYIHIGWDYYMYIGTNVDTPEAVEYAKSLGLFVESRDSPYLII